ncbi:restriction endonuclease subunit S [Parasediminibacterium sp. JCM 36343]|uniref:restriction endonuclease subunit S n=1 Tax=Parasediminibacterium sp. JCM 36343 TaxID=3374279 RepID=UPI00397BBFBF
MMRDMREGWEIKKLGEIGKVSMCKRVFKEDTTTEGGIPFYKIGTFGKNPDAFITKERYNEFRSKFSFPKKGDILISASGTIGRRVRYDGEPAYFQDSNIVWIDNNEKLVLNDYLYRFYEICNWGASKGATISRLYNDNLKQIEISYPESLPEQQRIVAILDKAFAAIAKAKANAEQNLQNAKELFESYLQGVFERKGEGWEENILKEVCELKSGTTISPSLERTEGDVLYTKVGDMNLPDNEVEINTSSRFVNSKEIKINQIIPEGAIIFPKRGGAIATNKKRKIIKPTIVDLNTMAIIPSKKIDKDYFFHWFQLFDLNSISNGANIPQINNYSFDEVYIPYPKSIKQQQVIVQKLDELLTETKKLEAIYQQKINDLEELKKSILQKAFSGGLNYDF